MQQKMMSAALAAGMMMASSVWAASPTNIEYASKSGDAKLYNVRCSDGKKTEISSWDDRKTWCVGKSKQSCSNDQLKTAKDACK